MTEQRGASRLAGGRAEPPCKVRFKLSMLDLTMIVRCIGALSKQDLDTYLIRYNTERLHQGRGMKGRTPADVFVRCLPKPKAPKEDKMKQDA